MDMIERMPRAILLLVGTEIVIMDLEVSLKLCVRALASHRFSVDCRQTSPRSYRVPGGIQFKVDSQAMSLKPTHSGKQGLTERLTLLTFETVTS